ncbi:MAG: co-chaperone GroES [Planctomycetota bacterium]|jgi:chaperonin GroES
MKLKPLDDRIVIKQSEADEKTAGGIILPEAAKEGKTLDDGTRSKMSVKKNDKVIYGKYMGNDVEIDGKKYVILSENNVLGIIED